MTAHGGGRAGDGRRERGAKAGHPVARSPREDVAAPPPVAGEAPMTPTCVKVLLVEAAALAALWVFQVVFGDP